MLYEDMMRLSQLLQDGFKMKFTVGGWSFSWYEVFAFDIIASILIMVIVDIVRDMD